MVILMMGFWKQTYKTAVPNLGYAYPQGYVKSLKGYASFRITVRFLMKQLTNVTREYVSFSFFCVGVREQKKVGNRCSRAR